MKWTWDKFGIVSDSTPPASPVLQRIPNLILKCLHLTDISGVRVQFFDTIGKAVVVVQAKAVNPTWQEIGEASHQSGWDVEVFTSANFERLKRLAVDDFIAVEAITAELADALVDHGYFTLQDLIRIDPDILCRIGNLDLQQADAMIRQAEIQAEQMEI